MRLPTGEVSDRTSRNVRQRAKVLAASAQAGVTGDPLVHLQPVQLLARLPGYLLERRLLHLDQTMMRWSEVMSASRAWRNPDRNSP